MSESITPREFFFNTFNHYFLSDEEKETIIQAIGLYSKPAVDALKQIAYMSDPGSYEKGIVDMKAIASETLKKYSSQTA